MDSTAQSRNIRLNRLLQLEGRGVTLHKRGPVWYVYFRHKGAQYNRSTGCESFDDGQVRAAQIVLEVARSTAKPSELEAQPSDGPKTDSGLEHVVTLYRQWLQSPLMPGEKRRPKLRTATAYLQRLRLLAEKLHVATITELRNKVSNPNSPMTAHSLGVTEARYVPLVRGAACVFGLRALAYFEQQGLKIRNPFYGYIPAVIPQQPFVPWSRERVAALVHAARLELKEAFLRDYLLFYLTLTTGARVQEAAFLRWADITECIIRITSSSDHPTKPGRTHDVPVDQSVLEELEPYRTLPLSYVIPDGAAPTTTAKLGVAKGRCYRSARRLAKWLKSKGVKSRNPIHWLRKIFGSRVTEQYGIHTASKWLGHSSVIVTERTYAGIADDRRAKVI